MEYDARRIDLPPGGAADFSIADPRGGTRTTTLLVTNWQTGDSWVATFTVGEPQLRRAISALLGTPSPTTLCVIERGTGFLVDVRRPDEASVIPTDGPIVGVEEARADSLLLLLTPWSITAVNPEGVMWMSPRVAIEGLRVDEVENGWLRGVADPDDDEPRDFAINLATGQLVGGQGHIF